MSLFSVAKATLEIALSVHPLVSPFVTPFQQESSRSTLIINYFIHQSTLITIHLFNFSSTLSRLLRLLVLFIQNDPSEILYKIFIIGIDEEDDEGTNIRLAYRTKMSTSFASVLRAKVMRKINARWLKYCSCIQAMGWKPSVSLYLPCVLFIFIHNYA